MDFLVLHCAVEHRWWDEKHAWVPQLVVTNGGPSVAHDAAVTARSSHGAAGWTHGPVLLGDLAAGQSKRFDLLFRPSDATTPLTVVFNWTDQGGDETHETKVVPPPPPPLPIDEQFRQAGSHRRRRR